MATMQDIRRRIRSINNIQQITRAMKMVAAAKLRRAQRALFAGRPYSDKMEEVLLRLGAHVDTSLHPLLAQREIKNTGFVIITADRGLAGGFAAGVIRTALKELEKYDPSSVHLITVGRKGRDYFQHRKNQYSIMGDFVGLGDEISFAKANLIANSLTEFYLSELLDEVYLVYPRFVNTLTQQPTVTRLLPLSAPTGEAEGPVSEYLFEPSPEAVLEALLPRYVSTLVYRALLEARASEEAARMTAMEAATKNADEMIEDLTMSFNRARQASITNEISEIVAGAEALK
ncbi:MAG: F0F1 ATP synthase subunit gamma [Firmicutes bacterium]|nr:F0F1 ATP synthase subunit gamma [Bacillota bacterium]